MGQMDSSAPQSDVEAAKFKGGCCVDGESASNHNEPCKPGQECHTGQLSISHVAALLMLNETSSVSVSLTDQHYTPLAMGTIWRPPLPTSL